MRMLFVCDYLCTIVPFSCCESSHSNISFPPTACPGSVFKGRFCLTDDLRHVAVFWVLFQNENPSTWFHAFSRPSSICFGLNMVSNGVLCCCVVNRVRGEQQKPTFSQPLVASLSLTWLIGSIHLDANVTAEQRKSPVLPSLYAIHYLPRWWMVFYPKRESVIGFCFPFLVCLLCWASRAENR